MISNQNSDIEPIIIQTFNEKDSLLLLHFVIKVFLLLNDKVLKIIAINWIFLFVNLSFVFELFDNTIKCYT